MPKKNNIWKPFKFANSDIPLEAPASAIPLNPGPQNPRVRTTRQVRKAYLARRAIGSTTTGVYVFPGASATLEEDQSGYADQSGPSTPRATTPDQSRSPQSSSPPNDAPGWSSAFPSSPEPTSGFAHYRLTHANQRTKWTTVVIPQLVQPYLYLLHQSDSLTSVDHRSSLVCTCQMVRPRLLKVTCVHFDCEFMLLLFMQDQDVNFVQLL